MPRKKGRKKNYFGPIEEEAVVLFLNTDDDALRNEIYNKWLKLPFNKMIESIIRRYKLYRKRETFEDLHADTLSHLITKTDKFDTNLGKKAYSYYGTTCRNYLTGLLIKDERELKQFTPYEDVFRKIEEREDLIYELDDDDETPLKEFIKTLSSEIKKVLDKNKINNKGLTTLEIKVGNALLDIFDNEDVIFDLLTDGKKHNKILILSILRESTNLSTKDIRLGLKIYKNLYKNVKDRLISDGLL